MVLFGVTSIFTNVLVDKAIEMILKRELKRKKKTTIELYWDWFRKYFYG